MDDHYDSITRFVESLPREVDSIAICGTSYTDTGGIARVIEQQAIELAGNGFDVEIDTLIGDKDLRRTLRSTRSAGSRQHRTRRLTS